MGYVISVIMCAHNEEKYVGPALKSVKRALMNIDGEIIFVADRCSDKTVEIASKIGVDKLIVKDWKKWKNSYAESLQTGFLNSSGSHISIIDADILVPKNFFEMMLSELNEEKDVVSVSAMVETYPSNILNSIIRAWEKTHNISPFGREPRGAARIINRKVLLEIGGFKDVRAPDTDLDLRLRERRYKSKYVNKMKVWHIRKNTLSKVFKNQLSAGIARYELGITLMRTSAHTVFRMRPLVIYGWLYGWIQHYASR